MPKDKEIGAGMNKLIFQIGLLSFFIATVFFGLQEYPLLELVSRAFIVFMGVVLALSGIAALSTMFARKEIAHQREEQRVAGKKPQAAE